MYQVITMLGENEPWWFFDDWQEDVQTKVEYKDFSEALEAFEKVFLSFHQKLPKIKIKDHFLVACWDPEELQYCDDCDEDLQLYHGILLLKNGKKIDVEGREANEAINYRRKTKCCKRPS